MSQSQSKSSDAEYAEDLENAGNVDNVDGVDGVELYGDEWEEDERQEIPGSSTADVVTLLFMAAMIIATVFCFVFLM
ncbi:hypothetical protein ACT3SZ_02370 [Corynebacterium sp. AOP40-9SA-29]|uniref:hypothetical protein n=1 Tax=Corynebacterium sp. AOP40-9SA-29 TaxID=3457677 RepID=UPI004033F65F